MPGSEALNLIVCGTLCIFFLHIHCKTAIMQVLGGLLQLLLLFHLRVCVCLASAAATIVICFLFSCSLRGEHGLDNIK